MTNDELSMSEVAIYGTLTQPPTPPAPVLSLSGLLAFQSSTVVGGPATAAIDGLFNTSSRTTPSANPWWYLDLKTSTLVSAGAAAA